MQEMSMRQNEAKWGKRPGNWWRQEHGASNYTGFGFQAWESQTHLVHFSQPQFLLHRKDCKPTEFYRGDENKQGEVIKEEFEGECLYMSVCINVRTFVLNFYLIK